MKIYDITCLVLKEVLEEKEKFPREVLELCCS